MKLKSTRLQLLWSKCEVDQELFEHLPNEAELEVIVAGFVDDLECPLNMSTPLVSSLSRDINSAAPYNIGQSSLYLPVQPLTPHNIKSHDPVNKLRPGYITPSQISGRTLMEGQSNNTIHSRLATVPLFTTSQLERNVGSPHLHIQDTFTMEDVPSTCNIPSTSNIHSTSNIPSTSNIHSTYNIPSTSSGLPYLDMASGPSTVRMVTHSKTLLHEGAFQHCEKSNLALPDFNEALKGYLNCRVVLPTLRKSFEDELAAFCRANRPEGMGARKGFYRDLGDALLTAYPRSGNQSTLLRKYVKKTATRLRSSTYEASEKGRALRLKQRVASRRPPSAILVIVPSEPFHVLPPEEANHLLSEICNWTRVDVEHIRQLMAASVFMRQDASYSVLEEVPPFLRRPDFILHETSLRFTNFSLDKALSLMSRATDLVRTKFLSDGGALGDADVWRWIAAKVKPPRSTADAIVWSSESAATAKPALGPQLLICDDSFTLLHRNGVVCNWILQDLPGGYLSSVLVVLAAYYAFGLTYPKAYASLLAVLQSLCMDFRLFVFLTFSRLLKF